MQGSRINNPSRSPFLGRHDGITIPHGSHRSRLRTRNPLSFVFFLPPEGTRSPLWDLPCCSTTGQHFCRSACIWHHIRSFPRLQTGECCSWLKACQPSVWHPLFGSSFLIHRTRQDSFTEEEKRVAVARGVKQAGAADRVGMIVWKDIAAALMDPIAWFTAVSLWVGASG